MKFHRKKIIDLSLTLYTVLLLLIFHFNAYAQDNALYEAENANLTGTAIIVTCNSASGGQMVKGLDNGEANAIGFQNINISEAGDYFIRISYFAVSQRKLTWKTNNGNEESVIVPASGLWCYQGGVPADYTFQVHFSEGNNHMLFYNSPIIDRIMVMADTTARKPATFYVSSVSGDDSNDGISESTPWKSIEKINALELVPGDSILFHSGEIYLGEMVLKNEGGSAQLPIFIGSYGDGEKPILDGDGYLSALHIVNSGYLHLSNLEIKNDGGPSKPNVSEDLRYGMYFENTHSDGTFFEHFRLTNLTFKNIYPTTQISDDDKTGVNAHAIITSGSWGDNAHPTRFRDMQIENCYFTRTARHAAVFNSVDSLNIRNNLFEHVGGSGMVIGNNCTNILVEKNTTNYTGSKIDSRMAGRGSGMWCYRSKNLTVQHNSFMHARGIYDSYGMHIDIGNRNVVYQYNFSMDNEGGFAEILGGNVNIGYRFNLSIADGWRKRGNRFGQIFWLAAWSGDPQNPIGSDSIFIYNNSIFVPDTITPGIWIESESKHARIYNNIIYAPKAFGPVVIRNNSEYNDFDNNIWYGRIPSTNQDYELYRGKHSLTTNPLFKNEIVTDSLDFILQEESPAIGNGKLVYDPENSRPFDYFINNDGTDYFGYKLSVNQSPNIGAYNGELSVSVAMNPESNQEIKLYPNPVEFNSDLTIEIPLQMNTSDLKIQIMNVEGKVLFEKSFPGENRVKLHTGSLFKGIYMIRISAGKIRNVRKLIIF